MGRESRARSQSRRVDVSDSWPIYWYPCRVCGLKFPSLFNGTDPRNAAVEQVEVCQRCCVADLASLMRSHPATVRMLPTVMALEGRPIVVPLEGGATTQALRLGELRSGDKAERSDWPI